MSYGPERYGPNWQSVTNVESRYERSAVILSLLEIFFIEAITAAFSAIIGSALEA